MASDIEAAINRLAVQRSATPDSGMALAFVGAKGGVGTTTVAVNVATTLARLVPGSTLLVDLHVANGDAAVFLGAEPRFSIVDALENTHRLDEAFFRNVIVKTKAGVDLLSSSERVMTSPLDVRRIRTLLEMAERHYRYVVLDIPRSDAAVLDALEGVKQIVIVANQELNGSQRQPHGRDAAPAAREGQADGGPSRPDRLAEIGHERGTRRWRQGEAHLPRRLPARARSVEQGAPARPRNHNELSGSLERLARSLAGLEKPVAATKAARVHPVRKRKPVTAGA